MLADDDIIGGAEVRKRVTAESIRERTPKEPAAAAAVTLYTNGDHDRGNDGAPVRRIAQSRYRRAPGVHAIATRYETSTITTTFPGRPQKPVRIYVITIMHNIIVIRRIDNDKQ